MSKALYLVVICVMTACTWSKPAEVVPTASCAKTNNDTISFSKDLIPLFNQHCVRCHSGSSPDGKLSLEPSKAYAQLAHPAKGYIDTLNPDMSVLYSAMTSISDPMPPSGALGKCETDLIYNWMKQKAKNN